MFELSKLSGRYDVRRLNESDADDILALCLENTQYYAYCGRQPSRELILNDLRVTPPGIPASAKYYVGLFDAGGLAAIMDLIDGYPDENVAFIGFFMMKRQLQGRGTGSEIIREVCRYLEEAGIASVMLGIDKGNPQAVHFWEKNGFAVVGEVKQDGGTLLVAQKELSPAGAEAADA